MSDVQLPERKFVEGPKKMVSWRLPESLMKELDTLSKSKGWTTTDLVVTVLDQYLQLQIKKSKK
jgi:predicted DNA-binding protein